MAGAGCGDGKSFPGISPVPLTLLQGLLEVVDSSHLLS